MNARQGDVYLVDRERADKVMVSLGLVESRQKAQALIMAGLVFSAGSRIDKPGQKIRIGQDISIKERMPYVSRGGLKLTSALDDFDISVEGRIAADLGVSTGGFTDCLLQRGAKKVYAVDVDVRQVNWHLREDKRVILVEKNARYLTKEDFDDAIDIITTDLSFISVLKVLPALKEFLGEGKLISLIKPQFEVGRHQVGKKGIVRDPALHEDVLLKIIQDSQKMGFRLKGLASSSVPGVKGNREFFVYWTLKEKPVSLEGIKKLIKEAVWDEEN